METQTNTITIVSGPKKGEVKQAKKNYRKARQAIDSLTRPPALVRKPPVVQTFEKKCTDCSETFTTDSKWVTTCATCNMLSRFREQIGNNIRDAYYTTIPNLDADLVYHDYNVRITYEVEYRTHDGYCSDHRDSDVKTKNFTKTIVLPLFKKFKSADFDPNTNEVSNRELLDKMYKPQRHYGCNCGDGHVRFSITTAIIFKKSDAIKLDD